MKKILIFSLFGFMSLGAVLLTLSCVSQNPATPNFQSPLKTVAALNPTITVTFTATNSPTGTSTDTPTVTPTDTPSNTPTNTVTPTFTCDILVTPMCGNQ